MSNYCSHEVTQLAVTSRASPTGAARTGRTCTSKHRASMTSYPSSCEPEPGYHHGITPQPQAVDRIVSPSKTEPELGPALRPTYMWSLPKEGVPESLSSRGGIQANHGKQHNRPEGRTNKQQPKAHTWPRSEDVKRHRALEGRRRNLKRGSHAVNILWPAGPLNTQPRQQQQQHCKAETSVGLFCFLFWDHILPSSLFYGTSRFSLDFFCPFFFVNHIPSNRREKISTIITCIQRPLRRSVSGVIRPSSNVARGCSVRSIQVKYSSKGTRQSFQRGQYHHKCSRVSLGAPHGQFSVHGGSRNFASLLRVHTVPKRILRRMPCIR